MKGLKIAIHILLIMLFQGVFLRFVRIFGIAPEMFFVYCVCFAYFEKKPTYFITVGAVCGLAAGIYSGGNIAFFLVSYIVSVLGVSSLTELLYNKPYFFVMPLAFVFTYLLNTGYYFVYCSGLGGLTYAEALTAVILPAAVYNTAVSAAMGYIAKKGAAMEDNKKRVR